MAGRPAITLTDEQRAEMETLASVLNQDQIADYFGITRPTLAALMERDEDISLRYKRGKAKAIGKIAQSLVQKARAGDTTAMIFYLKTQASWREKQEVDVTSSDGSMTPQVVERIIIQAKDADG